MSVSQKVLSMYVSKGIKHQEFISFKYQAKTWDKPQSCYSKIESTGKGLIVRHFISNKDEEAKKWQISTIRVALLKVGATIKKTKRRIYYRFSRAFPHQDLLRQLILQ